MKNIENQNKIIVGQSVYYADKEDMEIKKGNVLSVKTKDGNVETFLVNFPAFAFNEDFHASEWDDCIFKTYIQAQNSLKGE